MLPSGAVLLAHNKVQTTPGLHLELGNASGWPVLGEAGRWRDAEEAGILFNLRNPQLPGTHFDTSCATHVTRLPHDGAPWHMVELAPHVSLIPGANASLVRSPRIARATRTRCDSP